MRPRLAPRAALLLVCCCCCACLREPNTVGKPCLTDADCASDVFECVPTAAAGGRCLLRARAAAGEGEGEGEGEGDGDGEGEGEPADGVCQLRCVVDADCANGAGGVRCEAGACVAEACGDDLECVALFSGWLQTDTDGDFVGDADCTVAIGCSFFGYICIDLFGGRGRCAISPDALGLDCAAVSQTELFAVDIFGNDALVCGFPGGFDAFCGVDGICGNPCFGDADCFAGTFCAPDGSRCVQCRDDDDCSGGPFARCIAALGACGCVDDVECAGSFGGPRCGPLGCGCVDDAECPDPATSCAPVALP